MPTQYAQWTQGRVRYGVTLSSAGTSDPVWLDWPGKHPLSVAAYPSGGTARVEYTLDDRDAVDAGTAIWVQ